MRRLATLALVGVVADGMLELGGSEPRGRSRDANPGGYAHRSSSHTNAERHAGSHRRRADTDATPRPWPR